MDLMDQILNSVKDNSDETLEETIIKQQETIHKLTSVINDLPGSIYWKDIDGYYLGNNHFSTKKMKESGLTRQSILGKTDYDLFPKPVADQYRQFDLAVMASGKESVQEESVTLPTGETLIQLSYKRPLKDAHGTTVGVIGNTVDITYLKKIEAELREAKDRAELANLSKTELLRHMEHDIRTPFNGIFTLTTLLASRERNVEKKDALKDIAKSAKQLLDYCNNILYFARTDSGVAPIISKMFNVRTLIENVIAMETVTAKNKGVKLLVEYSDEVPSVVMSDPNRIQKILLNLISNAIKFTDRGYVKVILTLEKKVDDKTSVICLTVEDTGCGISYEKQVFLREQGQKTDLRDFGYAGHGLGLPIVKLLIQELEGTIDLKSESGSGTKFSCYLLMEIPKEVQ